MDQFWNPSQFTTANKPFSHNTESVINKLPSPPYSTLSDMASSWSVSNEANPGTIARQRNNQQHRPAHFSQTQQIQSHAMAAPALYSRSSDEQPQGRILSNTRVDPTSYNDAALLEGGSAQQTFFLPQNQSQRSSVNMTSHHPMQATSTLHSQGSSILSTSQPMHSSRPTFHQPTQHRSQMPPHNQYQQQSTLLTSPLRPRSLAALRAKARSSSHLNSVSTAAIAAAKTSSTVDDKEALRRVVHCAVERERRERIKVKLDELKAVIPSCASMASTQKIVLLESAVTYIKSLEMLIGDLESRLSQYEGTSNVSEERSPPFSETQLVDRYPQTDAASAVDYAYSPTSANDHPHPHLHHPYQRPRHSHCTSSPESSIAQQAQHSHASHTRVKSEQLNLKGPMHTPNNTHGRLLAPTLKPNVANVYSANTALVTTDGSWEYRSNYQNPHQHTNHAQQHQEPTINQQQYPTHSRRTSFYDSDISPVHSPKNLLSVGSLIT
ncbi:hypothetical protein BATDEDRAFT_22254 [Batrachochytrium dendrobatidis JAM81]|uniref:BHLH domain-containing protein n=2 Tax=Batrachochytrium dendrobatidis (strain JAM81 / FGSC 10211) TaxID=684364 RepID=F4NTB5_BATDJ|nr:uncharacterized protein BATDEDRAFT_22254 [Batrachochytrium dendrobatidis JAM81]KAJ8327072.1 hypothetical protein O5D80_004496 [Batrachochytrium dendrobatidis]EGF83502.1 hypothetical protein BATDEDRAFT_22254 [Batrachochytrium dendrobatidis JAM81]KAJ8327103.1 hypothetical protein O5D80_004521 [Batrachochytrium dendrobatidis]KAK5667988.1 hypothetical protein QVD99_005035 [Batrachochytrium dendrobatidis]KAK5668017.1 hypothetical protein QVD99_005061 [Batrachochytrium dendrobatidis]|eukprot:XP_006675512.1 hypothetical protein BATDEDRAFT_22254 [Batrachochytrium dendrobatidis JAM81]